MTRTEVRTQFTTPVRVALLEGDLDATDRVLAEIKDLLGRFIARTVMIGIGLLVSITACAIALAFNLIAQQPVTTSQPSTTNTTTKAVANRTRTTKTPTQLVAAGAPQTTGTTSQPTTTTRRTILTIPNLLP